MPKSAFRVVEPFATVDPDGVRCVFGIGRIVPGGHWVLKGRESLFAPVLDDVETADADTGDVEQATANPGEKRTVTKRTRKG